MAAKGAINVKIVLVGDGAVGKTSILYRYRNPDTDDWHKEYIPTVIDNFTEQKTMNINNENINVHISFWDTAGQEDYDRLRPLSYPQTTVVFYCFSISSHMSFGNMSTMWIPEINHHLNLNKSTNFIIN